MKVILKVNPGSVYASYNGHTFEANEVTSQYVTIKCLNKEFPDVGISFGLSEVIVVDLAEEITKHQGQSHGSAGYYINCFLLTYCVNNQIELGSILDAEKFPIVEQVKKKLKL
jgi:hypothetical protein